MVCPHPQDPSLFNIFNVQNGALVGVFNGNKDSCRRSKTFANPFIQMSSMAASKPKLAP